VSEAYVIADPHFDHNNIIRLCERPFDSIDEMNETVVDNCKALVGKHGILYILGDLAFRNHGHWIDRLPGKKVMLFGNHDKIPQTELHKFSEVIGANRRTPGILVRKIIGCEFVMSHFPLLEWPGHYRHAYHLFGHCHGNLEGVVGSCDVGVDVWGFGPVPIELLKFHLDRERASNDCSPKSKLMVREGLVARASASRTAYAQD
jgi:calcineurin-like phosphoesterase family protein